MKNFTHLASALAEMGGLAEAQLAMALGALPRFDADLAQEAISADLAIDAQHQKVIEACLALLPNAGDLSGIDQRGILAAHKIALHLERIGDYSRNIAERTIILSQRQEMVPLPALRRLGTLVQQGLHQILNALARREMGLALQAWHADMVVDELYSSLFRESLRWMEGDQHMITSQVHALFIARSLERIGDHSSNIAEALHFWLTGNPWAEQRRNYDDTSKTLDPLATGLESMLRKAS